MHAVDNNRGAQLAAQLNLGEVVSWKLHWLVCKLQSLQTAMSKADFGSNSDLTTGTFARYVDELKAITLEFGRLRWEVKTMLGLDYEDEADPLFQHVDHYARYAEEVGKAGDYLERTATKILESASTRIHETIRSIGQGL